MNEHRKNVRQLVAVFMLTYVCVLIPMLLFAFGISGSTVKKLDDQIYEKQMARMNQVESQLQMIRQSYFDKSLELANDIDLRYAKMLDRTTARTGIEDLRQAALFDSLIDGVLLYFNDDGAYASVGYSKLDVYLDKTLGLDADSYAAAVDALTGEDFSASFLNKKSTTQTGYLLLHYPLSMFNASTDEGSVNYLIKISVIGEYLMPFMDYEPCYICLRAEDGSELYLAGQDGKLVGIPAASYPASEGYKVLSQDIDGLGMHIDVRYAAEVMDHVVSEMRRKNVILLTIGLFLSTLISLAISSWRVRQLTELETQIANGFPEEAKSRRNYEYELVRNTLMSTLYDKNEKIGERNRQIKRQTAYIVFHGLVTDRDVINQMMKPCGIELLERYYYIVGVRTERTFRSKIEELFDNAVCFNEETGEYLDTYVLMEAASPKTDTAFAAHRLQSRLLSAGIADARIAVSRVYESFSVSRLAYQEAEMILKSDSDDRSVMTWEEAEQQRIGSDADRMLDAFAEAVTRKDMTAIGRSLKKLAKLEGDPQNLHYGVLRILNDAGVLEGRSIDRSMFDELPDDTFFADVEKLIGQCYKEEELSDRFDTVIGYIGEHFCECTLSADEVAKHTGVDKTHLSRMFRSKLDMTYIDYLTNLRMEYACELLRTTDRSVQDICTSVGYIDQSSFRRKFKALYKKNISQYREQFRQEENA